MLSIGCQLPGILVKLEVDLHFKVWQDNLNVVDEDLVEPSRQVLGSALCSQRLIVIVSAEELLLVVQVLRNRLLSVDVLLGPVHDSDPAQLEVVHLVPENRHHRCLCSLVDDVDLCENADGAVTLGIAVNRSLQCVRSCEIGVCSRDSKNDGVRLLDILVNALLDLNVDVRWLARQSVLNETGEIDEREGNDGRGEKLQADREGETLSVPPVTLSVSATISLQISW